MEITTMPAPRPVLLSYSDASARLGVSRSTLRRLVDEGRVRPVRLRGRVLFSDVELARLVQAAR